MSDLVITAMTRRAGLVVVRWRYPPPYDYYNMGDDPVTLASFLGRPSNGYFQIRDNEGELVAFCCFGAEAQVPGGDYSASALDIGIGVRPDLTGRGQGRRYLDSVLAFGARRFGPGPQRLTVAAFNERALRLYRHAGFEETQRFAGAFSGRPFIVMMRP